MRISGGDGLLFTRGSIYRALTTNIAKGGNVKIDEKRDFIYVDDPN
jgi:hypothetical protein